MAVAPRFFKRPRWPPLGHPIFLSPVIKPAGHIGVKCVLRRRTALAFLLVSTYFPLAPSLFCGSTFHYRFSLPDRDPPFHLRYLVKLVNPVTVVLGTAPLVDGFHSSVALELPLVKSWSCFAIVPFFFFPRTVTALLFRRPSPSATFPPFFPLSAPPLQLLHLLTLLPLDQP